MPQLIRKIQGNNLTYVENNVQYVTYITGEIQREDYINLHGYTAYLQNLTQTDYTMGLIMPLNYGLKNPQNIQTITLQIDY